MKASQIKHGVFAAALLGWATAQAAVSISNVVVQQRWPWNGKVDIDYEVFSDSADDSIFVYPDVKENDRNIAIAPRTLTGDGVETAMIGARVKPGKHRMTWHMDTDEPSLHSSSSTITLHAVKGGLYLVVDLSGGPDAETYPIRYSDTPPDITTDDCRTTNLWLRLCLPGTFQMGSPSDEYGRKYCTYGYGEETLHTVNLTKPFYIGVFELTQKQYTLVMGSNPVTSSSYQGDTRPVANVSWTTIRGTAAGVAYPAHSQVDTWSFMGKLRARTGCLFDLPTEAQWEYACRAGTSGALNSGADWVWANLKYVARYSDNLYDNKGGFNGSHTKVGCYQPNQWGLYDMHGNVAELCLDWWKKNLGSTTVSDPVGPSAADDRYTGSNSWTTNCRMVRGGAFQDSGNSRAALRSAARSSCNVVNQWTASAYNGFRVACIPVVQ